MNNSLDIKITSASLFYFALPTIVSMVFMGIYTTVDGIFVAQLVGTDALSAVNIVLPIITVAIAIGTMFGTGGSAVIARKMGEGRNKEAKENFTLLVAVSIVVSLLLTILGLSFLEPLLYFLGASKEIMGYCRDYAQATLVFLPCTILAMVFEIFLITAGKAGLQLVLSILGGVTNMILDYLFIAVLGMGIQGAAIATGIGYSIPAVAGILYFICKRSGSLCISVPRWDSQVILKSCSNGASEMVTNLSMGIVTILFNNILMRLSGTDGVASITIILYAQCLLSAAYMGYSIGIAPVISFNYGGQNILRLQKIHRISRSILFGSSLATFLISMLFANFLVGIFARPHTAVFQMAVHGYRIFSLCFLFMGFNIYGSALFTALSNGKVSAIISFLRTLVFVVISILLLPVILGINGVWIAVPLAELLGLMVTIYYLRKYKAVYHFA